MFHLYTVYILIFFLSAKSTENKWCGNKIQIYLFVYNNSIVGIKIFYCGSQSYRKYVGRKSNCLNVNIYNTTILHYFIKKIKKINKTNILSLKTAIMEWFLDAL